MAFSFHKEMDVDLIIQQKLVGHLLGNVYFGMNGMEHSHCIVHLPQSIITYLFTHIRTHIHTHIRA